MRHQGNVRNSSHCWKPDVLAAKIVWIVCWQTQSCESLCVDDTMHMQSGKMDM